MFHKNGLHIYWWSVWIVSLFLQLISPSCSPCCWLQVDSSYNLPSPGAGASTVILHYFLPGWNLISDWALCCLASYFDWRLRSCLFYCFSMVGAAMRIRGIIYCSTKIFGTFRKYLMHQATRRWRPRRRCTAARWCSWSGASRWWPGTSSPPWTQTASTAR